MHGNVVDVGSEFAWRSDDLRRVEKWGQPKVEFHGQIISRVLIQVRVRSIRQELPPRLLLAAMSKALNSPTARLLRSSRLFSLPPPLPAPSLETVSSQGYLRSSDTATLPYPTHQAISTPPSSKHRGDWGLKRPLPSRSVPSSTPHLRVRQIDNLNHITDFASAADHTQTVAKWQEMNVPMTRRHDKVSVSDNERLNHVISAFEEELDNTSLGHGMRESDMSASRAMQLRHVNGGAQTRRWKTSGPWVSGMSEGDFQYYLKTTVRKNKEGFIQFLEDVKVGQKREQSLSAMRHEGLLSDQDERLTELELLRTSKLDEHELDDFIKELRDNNGSDLNLSTKLFGLVRDYFDLPPFPAPMEANSELSKTLEKFIISTDSHDGPPATHPSAGLSYIRTAAYMENHPVHGPQARRSPVQARVLQTSAATGRDQGAKFGVAGIVVVDPTKTSHKPSGRNNMPMTADDMFNQAASVFDTESAGGNKVWIHPTRAHIDENGHIRLAIQRGDGQAIGVKTGNPIEMPTPNTSSAAGRMMPLDAAPNTYPQQSANYGTGLPNYRIPRAKGFDSEEIENAAEGRGSQQYQAAHIEALLKGHNNENKKP